MPDFRPSPGFVLAKPKTREELNDSAFKLPDNSGKVSDSVGVAEVIEAGAIRTRDNSTEKEWTDKSLNKGDIIAFLPYTDVIIEINLEKFSIVPYSKIVAVKESK